MAKKKAKFLRKLFSIGGVFIFANLACALYARASTRHYAEKTTLEQCLGVQEICSLSVDENRMINWPVTHNSQIPKVWSRFYFLRGDQTLSQFTLNF